MNDFIVDIDGVIADFFSYYNSYIKEHIPNLPEPIETEWDFSKRYPEYKNKMNKLWDNFVNEDLFLYVPPLPDYLKVNDLNSILLTSRPKSARYSTIAWLESHGVKYKELIILGEGKDKIDHTNPDNIAAYFEDKPSNIRQFADEGVLTYKFTYPFNEDITGDNIIPVTGWKDIDTKKLVEKNSSNSN